MSLQHCEGNIDRRASATKLHTLGWLALMVVLWGLSWPVTRQALDSVPPLWLATLRFASAGICLFVFVAVKGKLRLPVRQDLPVILSVGILQMMLFTGLGMIAMQYTDTSRAVLLAYTTPLWSVLLTAIILKVRPGRGQLLALITGLSGVALICSPAEMQWNRYSLFAALLLLVCAIAWSVVIYHVRHHRWVSTPLQLAPWQMLIAAVLLAIVAVLFERPITDIHMTHNLLWELLFIGPVATSFCFVISSEYGRRITTFAMSNFTLGVPIIGALAAAVWLHHSLSLLFISGLVLICCGVFFTALTSRQ